MEGVERRKVPTSHPEKDIISTREHPKNGHIRNCETPSSAGNVVPKLLMCARSTARIVSSFPEVCKIEIKREKRVLDISNIGSVIHGTEDDIDCNKQEDKEGRNPCWHRAPAKRLLVAIAKSCWERDISLDQSMDATE